MKNNENDQSSQLKKTIYETQIIEAIKTMRY